MAQPFLPPQLGVGSIYLRSLDPLFRSHPHLLQVAEFELQTLWTKGTASAAIPRGNPLELQSLRTLPQRALTHGVGEPLAGTVCDHELHVTEFRLWSDQLAAAWTSEHLSILDIPGSDGPHPCGFLMPPLQTPAQVSLAAQNIIRRRAALGKPFAFETGVNYFAPRPSEIPDGEFFAAIAEQADCGILLDLNNLWCNQKNGRATIAEILAALPLDRVWEVHLAGAEFAHDHWLDAHSGAIDPELVALAADVIPAFPNLGAIIYEISSERLDPFGQTAFLNQIDILHRLWQTPRPAPTLTPSPPAPTPLPPELHALPPRPPALTPPAWERLLALRMLPAAHRPPAPTPATLDAADEQSFALYATLIASFRNGAIADLLPHTLRLLLIALGEPAVRDLLARYAAHTPPCIYPTDEALGFSRFLDRHPPTVPALADLLHFETAAIQAAADLRTVHVTLTHDIATLLDDLAATRLPGPTSELPPTTFELGIHPQPYVRQL